jgi:hypothetical protein
MSSWVDPRHTANIFQAAVDVDRFFFELYLHAGGSLDLQDASGCTALHYACSVGSEHLLELLLQHGASTSVSDAEGVTPLHWACRYADVAAMGLLVEARADPHQLDARGETPMDVAAGMGSECADALRGLIQGGRAGAACHQGDPVSMRVVPPLMATPRQVDFDAWTQSETDTVFYASRRFDRDLPSDIDTEMQTSPTRARVRAAKAAYRSQSYGASPRSSKYDRSESSSPAMAVVRVARPLLHGVQWLANWVLPVDRTRTDCWDRGRGKPIFEPERVSWNPLSLVRSASGYL